MSLIIGIAGKKRSGKDTVASMITELAGKIDIPAQKIAMADALKEELANIISVYTNKKYSEALQEMNTDETKERYRLLLQGWGTEIRRKDDPDYWVKATKDTIEEQQDDDEYSSIEKSIILIPDIRFMNEIEMVKSFEDLNNLFSTSFEKGIRL